MASAIAVIDRAVGKVRKPPSDLLQRHLSRQIAERDGQRETVALPPQAQFQVAIAERQPGVDGGRCAALLEGLADFGAGKHRLAQKRREIRSPAECVAPLRLPVRPTHHMIFIGANSPAAKLPRPLGRLQRT